MNKGNFLKTILGITAFSATGYVGFKKFNKKMISEELKKEEQDFLDDALTQELVNESIKYLKKETIDIEANDWELFKTIKKGKLGNVKCFQKDHIFIKDGKKRVISTYKGEGIYKGKPEDIIPIVMNETQKFRSKFDPLTVEFQKLNSSMQSKFNRKLKAYVRYKSPARLIVCDRDFVALSQVKADEKNNNIIFNPIVSLKDNNFPEKGKRNVVRADIKQCGWVFEYNEKTNTTKIFFISCADLCGNIPTWIFPVTLGAQPYNVSLLLDLLEQKRLESEI